MMTRRLLLALLMLGGSTPSLARQDGPSPSALATKTLRQGDLGPSVEILQRLLNARLTPSPGLGIDGDFGPATHEALVRFQESEGLKATGATDPETWKALGPPPPPEPEPPAPEVVNANQPAKEPADALEGPPYTTSKAWAVADGKTGELIVGQGADKPLDMASTTKIMTAYVVLQAARKDAKLLEETVTFSRGRTRLRVRRRGFGRVNPCRWASCCSGFCCLRGMMLRWRLVSTWVGGSSRWRLRNLTTGSLGSSRR